MTEILKLTYGIYPKTEKLRIRIGRWGRGIMGAGELEELIAHETHEFQDSARKAGVTAFTDPLFNWYDIFRPLSVLAEGIELGPLTRYGETNTFYRLPEIRGDLALKKNTAVYGEIEDNPPLPLYHVDQGDDQLAFVPGPETFYHFCGNIKGESFEEFSKELGTYYKSVLSKFRFRKTFVFESVPLEHSGLSSFYSSIRPQDTILFTVGNLDGSILSSAGARFHSVVTKTADGNFSVAKEYSEIPGLALVNAHNTKLEDGKDLKTRLEAAAEKHGLDRLYLTHTNYLDFLPRQIADRKLDLIGKAGE